MKQITLKSNSSLITRAYFLLFICLYLSCTFTSFAFEDDLPACTGTVINTFPYNESFETGIGDWTQNAGDDGNWTRDQNGTPSGGTGPVYASEGNWYMYTEASTGGTGNPVGSNANVILTSPCIDLTGEAEAFFSFDYFMYGAGMGTLVAEVSSDAGGSWTPLVTYTGQQQGFNDSPWRKEIIDLTAYAGNTINVRFNATTGPNFRSDITIDNINITTEPQYCGAMGIFQAASITRVIFNTIDNTTPSQNFSYGDHTAISTDVIQNNNYDLSAYLNTTGNNQFFVYAWIDWNQDYVFDSVSERYDLGTQVNVTNGITTNSPLTITVPNDAVVGTTRMRIISRVNGYPASPCEDDDNFFGEVEDYTINVVSATPQPEMDITGLGNSISDGDNTPSAIDDTDFGSILVSNSNSNTFVINNTGDVDLNLTGSSPYVTITGSSAFTLATIPSNNIPSGNTSSFAIVYTPVAIGTDNAIISIANDDLDENPYTFSITGRGTGPEPEMGITGLGNNILDGDITPTIVDGTDFGNLLTGSTAFNDFIINNTGTGDLNLTGGSPYVTITGPGAGEFTLTTAPSTPISASGGTSTFRITYNPSVNGTHTATVSIANNDSNENPYNFDISGFASNTLTPEIDITGAGISINNGDVTPDIIDNTDFNTVEISQSKTNDFVISNVGTGLLSLSGASPYVNITGPGSAMFSVTTVPSNTIGVSNSTTFQITYQPTAIGTHNATVIINNDDADENPYNFNISGEGIAPVNRYITAYYENFDVDQGGWVVSNPGGGTIWTYGQNAGEPTGEGNYFYTNTYNNYVDNSNTYVTSPIIDLSGYTDLRLQIDIRTLLENDFDDAMNIEYSSNGGASWNVLGTDAEPAENLWYNETDADGLGNEVDGWVGTNTSVFDVSKSQFSVSYIDLPAVLDNNSNVRFRVRFASDNDGIVDDGANFDNIFIFGNPIAAIMDPALGPADVTNNLQLWLKTNTGISSSSGSSSNMWLDQARDNNAEVSNENAPIFFDDQAENINHNPVLEFTEADRTQLKGKGGYNSQDYWIVMQQEGTIDGTTAGAFEGIVAGRKSNRQFSEDGSGFWTGNISIRFFGEDNMLNHMVGSTPASLTTPNTSYGKAYSSSTDSYTDEVIIINVKANSDNSSSEIYKNGIKVDNTDGFAFDQDTGTVGAQLPYVDFVNSPYSIGVSFAGLNRTDISTWFNGKITEFISYSSSNSTFDQEKIQSYLALKNGVTLHDINSTTVTREGDENYVDSDGNVYWNSIENFGFNFDIAGIGRDDDSGLNQKQSTSSNPGAVLTMGLTDIYATNSENITTNANTLNDKNFLVWGNNNNSFGAATPIVVDMSSEISGLNTTVDFTSVQRIWKVVETGSVGEVRVSIPEIALSATLSPPGDYLMFISDTPSFSPTSEYRVMNLDGLDLKASYDFDGVKYITFGYAPEYFYERSISFEGLQDYLDVGNELDRTGDFTISAWIKRIDNDYSIISKRNAAFSEGYDIALLPSNRIEMSWINGSGTQDIQSTITIPENEWHQFAFTYDGSEARLYIDGVLDRTETLSAPVANNQSFIIGAADGMSTTDFYEGTIDEVRVWDIALSEEQVRFIMNQEIEENGDLTVAGKIVPTTISKNEFSTTAWNNLAGYFPMNRYTFTNVKDESNNNLIAAIKNLETVDFQTAPLPYVSADNGPWTATATWENGSTQELPGATSISDNTITVDWNIVQTSHNVTTNNNNTVLSLDVQNNELSIENDSKIEVSHYLKLDGVLDLVGESQLVQIENSDLDVASSGSLERDQQGTSDTYSYNGWSSPVGTINTTANNQSYIVSNLMLDGSNENAPVSMLFSGGFNGAATTPITISAYWIWKFANNPAGDYASWQYVGPSGTMQVGEGYTMKGPGTGAITDPQNYTFIGKPNNSTDSDEIQLNVTSGNQYFVGNPFPSALDADDFIIDNPHLDGTLYFWEHWGGGTHILAGYQAGYGTYTLSGGVPAASHPSVDQTGSGTKTPGRYIPVGQGFFTEATSTGTIVINNSQRNFVRETSGSSFFFFTGNNNSNSNASNDSFENTVNHDDSYYDAPDTRKKFRFVFVSPQQYKREILLTRDERTTLGYDRMFDGINPGGPADDMKWMIGDQEAVIQAIPDFDELLELPIQLKTTTSGISVITLSDIENENINDKVYLKDALHNTYTNLKEEVFTIDLAPGEYNNRFFIVFKTNDQVNIPNDQNNEQDQDNTIASNENNKPEDSENTNDNEVSIMHNEDANNTFEVIETSVRYNGQSNTIVIDKEYSTEIFDIELYSMLGQLIKKWNPNNDTTQINLTASDVSIGAYLIKISASNQELTKRLIIH